MGKARDLLSELREAEARRNRVSELDRGAIATRPVPWGLAHVRIETIDGDLCIYEVDARWGEGAIIIAAEAGGELVDLVACTVACSPRNRRTATRLGRCSILGEDHLTRSLNTGAPLLLFQDPIAWLNGGGIGACVLDWADAARPLRQMPEIICSTQTLAARLHVELSRPLPLPPISFASRLGGAGAR